MQKKILVLLLLLVFVASGLAQGPDLLGYLKPANSPIDQIAIDSKPDQYYILRSGRTLEEISEPIGLMLGSGNAEMLMGPLPNGIFEPEQGFFLVEEIPLSAPLDLDRDGIADPFELQHPSVLNPFDGGDDILDPDGDGMSSEQEFLEGFDPEVADSYYLKGLSPSAGETMVSLTREIILRFHGEINPATVNPNSLYVLAGSQRVPGRVVVSSTRRFATFFYDQPLPASTEFRIVVDGNVIQLANGVFFDADQDGSPGGVGEFDFRTLPITRIPNTTVFGFVRDSNTLAPLQGVTIRVDAFPSANVVTDSNGRFELSNMPAPDFFVHIDGSTANAPPGFTYPNVGKPFHSVPGETVQIEMDGEPFDIYLPPMALDDIQPLDAAAPTPIVFGPSATDSLEDMFPSIDPTLWAEMELTVEPGAAVDEFGVPATTATLVPVPADRLPGPLPANVESELVISIQAPGATNFDVPAAVTFPNINGLPAGSKTAIMSFDHDAGEWRVVGPATVSADGRRIVSDPGVGIIAPGWHLPFSLAELLVGGGADPSDGCGGEALSFVSAGVQCGVAAVADAYTAGKGGNLVSGTFTAMSIAFDCGADFGGGGSGAGCGQSALLNGGATALQAFCVPFAGTALNCFGAGTALGNLLVCAFSGRVDSPAGNFFEDQERIVEALDAVRSGMFNDPAWDMLSGSDEDAAMGILVAVTEAIGDETDQGMVISPGERSTILALPRPSGITQADVTRLVDLYDNGNYDSQLYIEPAAAFFELWDELQAKGWNTVVDGFTRFWPEFLENLAGQLNSEPVDDTLFFYLNSADFEQRGTLDLGLVGSPINVSPDTSFTIRYARSVVDLDANGMNASVSWRVAITSATSGDAGSSTRIPTAIFGPAEPTDSDGDGLPDEVEAIVGTNPNNPDTDNDGITDEAELLQGLNPLDNVSFPLGIVASVEISGTPREIIVEGSDEDIFRSTAFVASSHGLSLLDVSDFSNPILLGEVELPGTASDVAADFRFDRAAVASGPEGIQIIDVSDLMMPEVLTTVPVPATQVDVYKGLLYAVGGFDLFVIDLLSGQILTLVPSVETIGITRVGSHLLTVGNDHVLRCFDVSGFMPVAEGTVAIPNAAGPLYAENGILYVVAENRGGYHTVDISDPGAPTLISPSGIMAPFAASGDDFAGNGTERGLLAGNLGIDLMNLNDPNNTTNALTRFSPSGRANTVAIARGVAFAGVSDGTVQTVNYMAFDANGVAPLVSLSAPGLTGTQVSEFSFIELDIDIQEDVQVRNVELLVDDMFMFNDLSAPFDFVFRAPPTIDGVDLPFQIKVRVTDTGGNRSESNVLSLQSINDPTPPTLLASSPNTTAAGVDVSSISLFFDRPVDTGDVTLGNFTLTNLGADGVVGGGDDTSVGLTGLTQIDGARLQLTIGSTLPTGVFVLDGGTLGSFTFRAITSTPGIVQWVGTSGDWDNPFNWSSGRIPDASDDVSIDVFATGEVITVPSGSFEVGSIDSVEALLLNGRLTVTDSEPQALLGTMVTALGGGNLVLQGGGTVVSLTVTNGGTLSVVGPEAGIEVLGPINLDGGNLLAEDGGVLDLSSVTAYRHNLTGFSADTALTARGAGSLIDLSNLQTLLGPDDVFQIVTISALEGGRIDLSAVTNFEPALTGGGGNGRGTHFFADGAGSVIDLSSLTSLDSLAGTTSDNRMEATNQGSILIPMVSRITRFSLVLDDANTFDLSNVTTFTNAILRASAGVFSYPGLINIDGASFTATEGSSITLGGVSAYTFDADGFSVDRQWVADGAGSQVNFPNLTSITGSADVFQILSISALNGGQIDLSAVSSFDMARAGGGGNGRGTYFLADGAGSEIDLSALTSLESSAGNTSDNRMEAKNQGLITAPLLTSAVEINFNLDDPTALPLANLTSFASCNLFVSGDAFSYPNLSDIDGASFSATDGAVLTLPGVSTYTFSLTGFSEDATWVADGAGSQILFPNLTTIVGPADVFQTLNINALDGGQVDLASVTSYDLARPGGGGNDRGSVLLADGANSEIDLSSLPNPASSAGNLSGNRVEVRNQGSILLPLVNAPKMAIQLDGTGTLPLSNLTSLDQGSITMMGGTLSLANLASIDGCRFDLSGGASLSLPAVSSFTYTLTGFSEDALWTANGVGTVLDFPNLTTITGPANVFQTHTISAVDGGTVGLASVNSIEAARTGGGGNERGTAIISDGTGASVDLSNLVAVSSSVEGASSFTARNAGNINAASLTTFDPERLTFTTETGGTITLP